MQIPELIRGSEFMKIESKPITREIKSEVQIANYSEDDIKRLIALDLEKQGYKAELSDISFVTAWHYESDDWGMNRHTVTTFEGAKVKIS